MNWVIECIGAVATVLIFVSMCFNTSTYRSSMALRITNVVGSLLFAVYGFVTKTYSTGILNVSLVGINIYHTIKLIKNNNVKENKSKDA